MKLAHLFLGCCIALLICFDTQAQTGPGGVGTSTNNVLWLKADAGTSSTSNGSTISFWNDQSGNAVDVTQTVTAQQPSFATNVINGYPAILFDNVNTAGQNDKLIGPDASVLDNTSGYTFFHVTRPLNLGDARVVMSKRTSVSVNQSFMLFYYTANNLYVDIQTTNDRFASVGSYTTNTNYLNCLVYNGAISTSSLRCTVYRGETFDRNATETSTLVPDNASPLLIGTTDAADSRPFGGYISELIIYREALNDASRILVNNYLSAKYDISLSANDKYAGDNSGNGNYDRDVAGVGQETSGSSTSFSASISGGISLNVNSGLNDGDYIMVGHAVATNTTITSDVGGMSGSNNARWERIWYVDVTNTLTALNVNLSFDMSDGGMPSFTLGTVSNYVLLYRSTQSGNWTELATAASISGDQIQFTNLTLSNDGYYTLGTRNLVPSPLPVELVSFSALPESGAVNLRWTTASERNNHYFTPQRSQDGEHYSDIARVDAKGGTTSRRQDYFLRDSLLVPGLWYYRLKQTDRDGSYTYSGIISIQFEDPAMQVELYPNPNSTEFFVRLQGLQGKTVGLTIFDASGRHVYEREMKVIGTEQELKVPLSLQLLPGVHFLRVVCGSEIQLKKFIVQ